MHPSIQTARHMCVFEGCVRVWVGGQMGIGEVVHWETGPKPEGAFTGENTDEEGKDKHRGLKRMRRTHADGSPKCWGKRRRMGEGFKGWESDGRSTEKSMPQIH